MSTSPLYLHGVAARLPRARISAVDAVAAGNYEDTYRETTGYTAVAVASSINPVDLAVGAGRDVLRGTNTQADSVKVLTFSAIHRHGHPPLWSPASYLQNKLQANSALAFSLVQGCNSQLIAAQVARDILRDREAHATALVTGGDVFEGSSFDRWRSDYVAYGDAGSAMLFGFEAKGARIASLATASRPELEAMHRHSQTFTAHHPDAAVLESDVRQSKRNFLHEQGGEALVAGTQAALAALVATTERNTGWNLSTLDHIVFPNLGQKVLTSTYYPLLPDAASKSRWEFGRNLGHLGTSDAAVGLAQLGQDNELVDGSRVLLVGAGAGFTWSMMALEIVGRFSASVGEEL